MGKSDTTNYLKAATKRQKHLGKQIVVQKESEKKTYFVSKLIQEPHVLHKSNNNWFSTSSKKKKGEYMFRYAFDHEQKNCNISYTFKEKEKDFAKNDQYDILQKEKKIVISQIFDKFMSKDKKIVKILSEVLQENFDEVFEEIKLLSEGQKKLLSGQDQIQSKIEQSKDELMLKMDMINSKLQGKHSVCINI